MRMPRVTWVVRSLNRLPVSVPILSATTKKRCNRFIRGQSVMTYLKNLVIHCTATPEGREVSAEEIRRWHTAPLHKGGRGWRQVGYTDMIHLDGTVERLVENNEDGVVDPWGNHQRCEGTQFRFPAHRVRWRGGCRRKDPPRTPGHRNKKKALEAYVKDFHRRFPRVRIVGHNELAAKACPWLRCQTLAFFK